MKDGIIIKYFSRIIFLGDVILFWLSLAITLLIRYDSQFFKEKITEHALLFFFIMLVWFVVFYVIDLYTHTSIKNAVKNKKKFVLALGVNFVLSLGIFYLSEKIFHLAPKTNFILFVVIFSTLDYLWRYFLSNKFVQRQKERKILMLASSPLTEEILSHIKENPQFKYSITKCSKNSIENEIKKDQYSAIVVDLENMSDPQITKKIYQYIPQNIDIITLADFYENLFGRIPISEIKEEWFISEIKSRTHIYNKTKLMINILAGIIIAIIISPIFLTIALLILLSSGNPILYRQKRTGKDGKMFTLYKFRTMHNDLKKNPDANGGNPTWSETEDKRITKTGKFLRETHLDELPQVFNLIKGNLVFVGPRPERPEFVEKLKDEIPHYFFRQIIKPGITGWAQINFRYARSVMDSKEKFEYDLYYIKNSSFLMDLGIILKTIKFIFI